MKRINLAVFASGSGSNAENITQYFDQHPLGRVALIVSNRADAFVLKRAERLGIPSRTISKSEFESADLVLNTLKEFHIDYIILAGFLLKVPNYLIDNFPQAIVNIHPALLPKYGGKGMYGHHVHQAVVEAKEVESGITIHYINDRIDEGEIIAQFTCAISPTDSCDDVARRVGELEYRHYPEVIASLLSQN